MSAEPETPHLEPPLGKLERALIDEYLRRQGHDTVSVADLPEAERQQLLTDASVYASGKLVEIEARSHYLDEIHRSETGTTKPGLD
jgi:hypothetical protein